MISDKERREVAERLRNCTLFTRGTCADWWMRTHEAVTGERDYLSPPATIAAISVWVDRPTCSIKREVRSGYPTTWGVCSKCGALVNAERAVSTATEYLPTRYCPHCGAEVVNES